MTNDDARMTQYLLGTMTDADREAFEREYFSNTAAFDRVVDAETDLIDRYVRGRLSADERTRFERLYLSHPQRRERVRFARALATEIDRLEDERRRASGPRAGSRWGLPLAAAAAVACAVAAGLFWNREASLRRQLAAAESARAAATQQLDQQLAAERAQNAALRAQLDRLAAASGTATGAARSTPFVVSLLLRAASERGPAGSAPARLSVPADATEVRVQLAVDDATEYSSFDLSVQRAGGVDVYAEQNVQPQRSGSGALFTARIQPDRLPAGDYVLTLRGRTTAGDVDDITRALFHVDRASSPASRR